MDTTVKAYVKKDICFENGKIKKGEFVHIHPTKDGMKFEFKGTEYSPYDFMDNLMLVSMA